jgi:hypothetical protein
VVMAPAGEWVMHHVVELLDDMLCALLEGNTGVRSSACCCEMQCLELRGGPKKAWLMCGLAPGIFTLLVTGLCWHACLCWMLACSKCIYLT